MITLALPIVFTIEPRMVSIDWPESNLIVACVFLVSVLKMQDLPYTPQIQVSS